MGWPHWEPHFGARLLSICKRLCYLCIPLVGTCGDTSPKHDIENCCSQLYICWWQFKYTICSAVSFFLGGDHSRCRMNPKACNLIYTRILTPAHTLAVQSNAYICSCYWCFFNLQSDKVGWNLTRGLQSCFYHQKKKQRTSIIQKTICTFANATSPYGTGTPCT